MTTVTDGGIDRYFEFGKWKIVMRRPTVWLVFLCVTASVPIYVIGDCTVNAHIAISELDETEFGVNFAPNRRLETGRTQY